MRAVAAEVARRVVFPRQLGVNACVASPTLVEVLRANQLLVAVGGREGFAGRAFAVPARDLLVAQLAAFGIIAVAPRAVGEAGVLGPDAAVNNADDDVLTGAAHAAQLFPQAVCFGQAEECRRSGGVQRAHFVGANGDDAGHRQHFCCLRLGEVCSKAVEGIAVAVELACATDGGQGLILAAFQEGGIFDDLRAERVDLLPLGGLRGRIACDVPRIGDNRRVNHLHDEGRANFYLIGATPFEVAVARNGRVLNATGGVYRAIGLRNCGQEYPGARVRRRWLILGPGRNDADKQHCSNE